MKSKDIYKVFAYLEVLRNYFGDEIVHGDALFHFETSLLSGIEEVEAGWVIDRIEDELVK